MTSAAKPNNAVVFQGLPGAYSHLACCEVFPDMHALPAQTFEDMFAAVRKKKAKLAMTPIENSVAGRVADIHRSVSYTHLKLPTNYSV